MATMINAKNIIQKLLLDGLFKNVRSVQTIRKYIRNYLHNKKLNSFDENDQRLNNPIFIWGLARSGTFLLYDILSLHKDLVCQRLTTGMNRHYKGLWGDKHWGKGEYEELIQGLGAPVEGRWRFSGGEPYDCPWIQNKGEKLSIDIIKHIRLYYAALFGQGDEGKLATRFLDKYPTYMLIVDLIDQVFPDAIHIWCIKDPRSVLRSALRMQIEVFENEFQHSNLFSGMIPAGYKEYLKKEFVKRNCWQVVRLVETGFSNLELLKKRAIIIYFEAICTNPREIFSHLLELLILPETNLLPSSLPVRFEQYGTHPNDEYWKDFYTDIVNGESELGQSLIRLSQKLGYGEDVGKLDVNYFLPTMQSDGWTLFNQAIS